MINSVYDINMRRLAYLDNAYKVSYSCPINELWTAQFSLPADDPKNVYCTQYNIVRIYDGDEEIGLFRIIGEDRLRSTDAVTTYTCEHVLAMLMDDVLFRYHHVGGITQRTNVVLNYILNAQTVQNWILDRCDFDRRFEYSFENENLLSAFFSVPKCFDVDYMWTWDTSIYPWRVRLVELPDTFSAEIRYSKNMLEMHKTADSTNLVNRIYALGYGEGINQLTIKSVNNDLPYVEDKTSQQKYGIKSTIIVDSRYKSEESLKGYALQKLQELSEPYYTYEVAAVDLYRLAKDYSSRFRVGDVIRVIDTEDDISLRTRVISVEKSDVDGDPGNIKLVLSNKSKDLAGSISNLQQRARISETYSQGATNLMAQNFADNADPDNPAELDIYIPEEAVRINKVVMSIEFEEFRSYTQTIESYPGFTQTTNSGGSMTRSSGTNSAKVESTEEEILDTSNVYPGQTEGAAVHNHGIPQFKNNKQVWIPLYTIDNNGAYILAGYEGWVPSGAHMHPAHSHNFWLASHVHQVEFPNHVHDVSMPTHTHAMQMGIFRGESATGATVIVDDNELPPITDYSNIDLTMFLALDGSGKIQRGAFHKVKIIPNNMTRIIGALFTQLFIAPQSGGDF